MQQVLDPYPAAFAAPDDAQADPRGVCTVLLERGVLFRGDGQGRGLPREHRKDHVVWQRCAPHYDLGDASRVVGYLPNPGPIQARPEKQRSFQVARRGLLDDSASGSRGGPPRRLRTPVGSLCAT